MFARSVEEWCFRKYFSLSFFLFISFHVHTPRASSRFSLLVTTKKNYVWSVVDMGFICLFLRWLSTSTSPLFAVCDKSFCCFPTLLTHRSFSSSLQSHFLWFHRSHHTSFYPFDRAYNSFARWRDRYVQTAAVAACVVNLTTTTTTIPPFSSFSVCTTFSFAVDENRRRLNAAGWARVKSLGSDVDTVCP